MKLEVKIARQLRLNSTHEEKVVWELLRNRKFHGLKFLRQHPIIYGQDIDGNELFFVPDFYCASQKLIIEIDGKIHEFQKDYDAHREEVLTKLGLRVVRFNNEEVSDIDAILRKLSSAIE